MALKWSEFEKVDIRVGRIIAAELFEEAQSPAYKLKIDFGELGLKKSSAQLTANYQPNELVNRLVVAVMNFPPKQIGPMRSEVLVLGVPDEHSQPTLLVPTKEVPLGGRLY